MELVVSKIMGRIVIDRIRMGIDRRLRKEQAGFRSGRGTTEQIFILRNILEQVNEWQATLYINFVDFEKAFDSVHRNGLWMIMNQYGIPQKRPYAPTWRQRTGEGEDENRPSHTCMNNNNKLTTKKDFWKGVLGAPNTALTQKPLAYKGQVRKKKSKKSGK